MFSLPSAPAAALGIPRTHKVLVETGAQPDADTDANVYLSLQGSQGATDEVLNNPGVDDFERAHTDEFEVRFPYVGTLNSIFIRQDGAGSGSGWYLRRVFVTDTCTGLVRMASAERWLADTLPPYSRSASLLTQPNGNDPTPNHNDFERKQHDTFLIRGDPFAGQLNSSRIRHDNTGDGPGWYLNQINVTNECTMTTRAFV